MQQTTVDQERPAKPAIIEGLKMKCPNCREGKLFGRYLKSVDACDNCGEIFSHHRADDGPAYIVILIVCHVMGLMFHLLFEPLGGDALTMIAVLVPVAVVLCLVMLPRVKGGLIALQWAKRMHGFGETR